MTLAHVRELRDLREQESQATEPEAPKVDTNDWAKTMDAIREYFRGCLGTTGVPLSYVIRENEAVPAEDPEGGYDNPIDEMEARAPIRDGANFTATFLVDRRAVWDKLAALTRDHSCWTHVRVAQRTRDGRRGFLALYDFYLGPNNVGNAASAAEHKLDTTTYNGDKRRWTFEKYVAVHKEQHLILEGLKRHGYAGIDDGTKVRKLTSGIKTDRFDTVKTQILASPALRNDFDGCVNLFTDFIKQKSANHVVEHNVSATKTTASSGGGGGKDIVEDRYYKAPEYRKLSKAQKKRLAEIRADRGDSPKRRRTDGGTNKWAKNFKKVERQISALAAAVGAKLGEEGEEGTDDVSTSDETTKTGNRNHPSLTRQNGSRK